MPQTLLKAKVIRTIRPIPRGWFQSDGYLPINTYLEFAEKYQDGLMVFRQQLDSYSVRFKAGDFAPGLVSLSECFTPVSYF